MKNFLLTLGLIVALILGFAGPAIVGEASAQDTFGENAPIKRVSKKLPSPALFSASLFLRLNRETQSLRGPFDVIVASSDKADGPFKYSNVPYIVIMTDNIIAFPNGDWGKDGKAIAVITSNYTIRTK